MERKERKSPFAEHIRKFQTGQNSRKILNNEEHKELLDQKSYIFLFSAFFFVVIKMKSTVRFIDEVCYRKRRTKIPNLRL